MISVKVDSLLVTPCSCMFSSHQAVHAMQVWQVRGEDVTRLHGLEAPGHRSDIRTVALASDDSMLLSGSNNEVKIWNPRSGACLRTIEAGYGLCALFAPGNRHAVVGTKSGSLDLLDVAASSMVQSVAAHAGAVWSLAALPDSRSAILPHAPVVQLWTAPTAKQSISAMCTGQVMTATQAKDNVSCCCMATHCCCLGRGHNM